MEQYKKYLLAVPVLAAIAVTAYATVISDDDLQPAREQDRDRQIDRHAQRTLAEGRQTFRYDTFGDEAFWGDTVKLHQAIKGAKLGGVGGQA